MKKRIALSLALIMIMGMTIQANASTEGALYGCILSISCASDGVRVAFSEESTTEADEIGCKDIVLEEKIGSSWREINISGGSDTKSYDYAGNAVYTDAVKGRTYRASCTHYAVYGNVTKTLKSSTGEMVYN